MRQNSLSKSLSKKGEEVKFSPELVDEGFELAARGEKLMDTVFKIEEQDLYTTRGIEICHPQLRAQLLHQLHEAILSFEEKYHSFEKKYIEALIAVEKRSRSLISSVAELINDLWSPEQKTIVTQQLLDLLSQLDRKSRDKLAQEFDLGLLNMVLDRDYEKVTHKKLW